MLAIFHGERQYLWDMFSPGGLLSKTRSTAPHNSTTPQLDQHGISIPEYFIWGTISTGG